VEKKFPLFLFSFEDGVAPTGMEQQQQQQQQQQHDEYFFDFFFAWAKGELVKIGPFFSGANGCLVF
jgi:hypothetical protein